MPVKAKLQPQDLLQTLAPFPWPWYQGETTVWNKVAVFPFLLWPLSKLNPHFALCALPQPLPKR